MGEENFSRSSEGNSEERWGDGLSSKQEDVFRLLQINLGTLAEEADSDSFRGLVGVLTDLDVDCVTCQELNRAWNRLPECDRLFERFRGAFEAIHISESRYHNKVFARGSLQYGGTAVFSVNSAAHRVHNVHQRE